MMKTFALTLSLLSALFFTARAEALKQEPLDAYNQRMAWFADAQYGMFIHFGLYSILGGEWKGEPAEGYAEWIQARLDIPSDEYAKLIQQFNPTGFDADFLARTAKEAGMTYLVITAKHHEGFCLWDSNYTDFDVANSPFKGRDIVAELKAACEKHGLKFGIYYSIIDWNHPAQQPDRKTREGRFQWKHTALVAGMEQAYFDYQTNQVLELIAKYDPALLWFDGDWADWWNLEEGIKLYNAIRKASPDIIVNNRVARRELIEFDYVTQEQSHFAKAFHGHWEGCYTMNKSWGYKKRDHEWKDAETVYNKLKDINEKGGNFLLNVGPNERGMVQPEAIRILHETAALLKEKPVIKAKPGITQVPGVVKKSAGTAWRGSRPNIIFVLTDDQGLGDLSCMGNPILKTPHLDKFHAQSTRFTDFHVSPTCSPTRAALMSGRRPFEVGVTHTILQRERMAPGVVTVAQALQTAGYKTGLFGKWHLGDEGAYLPQNRGFDEVLMHGAGGIGQVKYGDFPPNAENTYFDSTLLHNDTVVKTRGFCTDVFFDAALSWIHQQELAENSYFAFIALNAPHSPLIAPEKYTKRFLEAGYDEKTAARYGMIENIDDNFGKMMAQLADWGDLKNTLVIFMTDNGMAIVPTLKDGKESPPFNAGLRGGKGSLWEGGTRVPSLWYWKGKLGEGVEIDALTAHIDIYRTFCDLAGAKVPENPLPPTGLSLLPLLENAKAAWPDRKLFFHVGRWGDDRPDSKSREESRTNGAAVRTERWRLVFPQAREKAEVFLSDILNDPGEQKNLADQHPDVVAELTAAFDAWWKSTEPFLVNEGLPEVSEWPFHRRYENQRKGQQQNSPARVTENQP